MSVNIPEKEIRLEFIRSSGPGGQNVNKVSTGVQLRFDVLRSTTLASELKGRLIQLAGKRINAEGVLVLESRRFRTQEANREDVLQKFYEMLAKAAQKPKARRKTKPTRASQEERLKEKKTRSGVKKLRAKKPGVDE